MKIAILGTRGIPACYSGFETCAEELSVRLLERGHEVTVYCRKHAVSQGGPSYRGVRRVILPTVRHKYLDTFVHTALSTLHALWQGYDLILYFGVGNAPFTLLPRLLGRPTLINVDGLDRMREKWNGPAQRYLGLCERLAGLCASHVITDARHIQRYYRARYGLRTTLIAYGATPLPAPSGEPPPFGLRSRGYILFVGRLVPENRAHDLLTAYRRLQTDLDLVIVGDAPYSEKYIASLKADPHPRIRFPGYVFGDLYRQLLRHCYLFVLPTAVGGTHPVLVEAMGAGAAVLASDIPSNLETLRDAGAFFRSDAGADDLERQLRKLLERPRLLAEYRRRARERVEGRYNWERVTEAYERLFTRYGSQGEGVCKR